MEEIKSVTIRAVLENIDLRGGIFPINPEKLGEDYDAEMIINSRGMYVYTCMCGSSSVGDLNDISLQEGKIRCLDCLTEIGAGAFVGSGPRMYKIYKSKEAHK